MPKETDQVFRKGIVICRKKLQEVQSTLHLVDEIEYPEIGDSIRKCRRTASRLLSELFHVDEKLQGVQEGTLNPNDPLQQSLPSGEDEAA